MRAVFELRNDPFIVERSTTRQPIDWSDHQAWFEKTLKIDNQLSFLINSQEGEKPIGVIRFEKKSDKKAIISAYLLEPYTRQGLGVHVIRAGCEMAFARLDIAEVLAYVRADNLAGQKAFKKAGFYRSEHAAGTGQEEPNSHVLFCLYGDSVLNGEIRDE